LLTIAMLASLGHEHELAGVPRIGLGDLMDVSAYRYPDLILDLGQHGQ